MEIRRTTLDDLSRVMKIYADAREFMKANGNPTQWGDTRPTEQTIRSDIEKGVGYVVLDGDEICGSFAFITFDDPTYRIIDDGSWPNDEEYTAIHRVASKRDKRGIVSFVTEWAKKRAKNLRIDTHHNNIPMQNALAKRGYTKCGIIYREDGSPRIAYAMVNEKYE